MSQTVSFTLIPLTFWPFVVRFLLPHSSAAELIQAEDDDEEDDKRMTTAASA